MPDNTPEVKTREEKDWIMDFDLLSLHLDMDGEQADEMRDFMRKIVASAKAEGRREEIINRSKKEDNITPYARLSYKHGLDEGRSRLKNEILTRMPTRRLQLTARDEFTQQLLDGYNGCLKEITDLISNL